MNRKWTLMILVMSLLGGLIPVGAQGAVWTAWLYDTGHMTEVNASGVVVEDFTLPLPAGFDRYPNRAAVGHNGSPVAYVVYNSTTFQGALVVSQRDQIIASFNLPLTISDSTEFVADASLFNEDNSMVALGYSLDGGGWGLIVLDLRSGAVSYTLRYDAPLVAALGLEAGNGLTPTVRRFNGRVVTFSMVQSGTEGQSHYDSYDWNIDSNGLTLNPVFPSLDADTFAPTGEVIMSLADERLPNHAADFTFFQANTLQVYQPTSGARYPFYNAPDQTLFSPRFIQNGELVLVDTTDSAARYHWTVIRRDGTLMGTLPTAVTINDVRGTPDGFIYTTNTFNPGATTLVEVNTRGGLNAGSPVWTSAPGANPVIAWVGSDTAEVQAAYVPWATLAAEVYAPGSTPVIAPAPDQPLLTPGVVSPSQISGGPTPIINRFLAAGGVAMVHTTEGDQLNIRLIPSVSADIIGKLADGERVALLEGPHTAEGFVWWKVRTASGIEGWVVESVNDNGERLQTLVPG
jgi:SH3 domain-containing protein